MEHLKNNKINIRVRSEIPKVFSASHKQNIVEKKLLYALKILLKVVIAFIQQLAARLLYMRG